ncbi:hypothetical protein ACFL5Z_19425, partial [Planctomycetota bacterium]
LGGVSDTEVMRVLAPNGVAYFKSQGQWTKMVKVRPREIDEWMHYLHDPSNNAVAHDSVIEPPSRYQWLAGPRYARQHDHMSSVSAVVSANGRLFYIFDEAPRASILIPPQWRLIARDAFNGKLLWKRNIELWHTHLWRLKSGPQLLARRLVAMGEKLYVTLGIDAPLSVLDAATGKTIRTYDGTKTTEEILCSDGVLILSVAKEGQPLRSDPTKRYPTLTEMNKDVTNPLWTQAPRTIMAIKTNTKTIVAIIQFFLVRCVRMTTSFNPKSPVNVLNTFLCILATIISKGLSISSTQRDIRNITHGHRLAPSF